MRVRWLTSVPIALGVSLILLLGLSSVALAADQYTATLQGGAAETPPGDPDGSGSSTITIDMQARSVCWNITVQNIMPATASHIHEGAPGTAGPVVVPLDTDGFQGSSEGCVQNQDAAVLQRIANNPAGFYVNVHTSDYQGGAVRGQLARAAAPNTAVSPVTPVSPLLLLGAALLLVAGASAVAVRATVSRSQ